MKRRHFWVYLATASFLAGLFGTLAPECRGTTTTEVPRYCVD